LGSDQQAMAAVRAGDTLLVPKLDRLARSVPDARAIGDSLVAREVKLSPWAARFTTRPTPWARCFFNILATFAEFEVDLLRIRTREGMAIARATGRLCGKQPKLSARQQAHLVQLHQDGQHTIAELAELFSVSRLTVYRVLERPAAPACRPATPRSAEDSALHAAEAPELSVCSAAAAALVLLFVCLVTYILR
jgi:DNA invertase Pin-like site-specific DNA recombinase